MTPFETRSTDGRSEHQIVVDLVRKLDLRTGDVLTYDQLHAELERGEDERDAVQQAARRASVQLQEEDLRVLVAVPRKGYRIAKPNEHIRIGRGRESRGLRQFRLAVRTYKQTPLDDLTESERTLLISTQMVTSAMVTAIEHNEKRIGDLEITGRSRDRRLGVIERHLGIRKPETIDHETGEIVSGRRAQAATDDASRSAGG
jgi:DNA-binding winged helix-turn-helix (wHTH) protein